MASTFDLIAIGEVLVEFSLEHPGPIERGSLWRSRWAGDVVNTLYYAARSGASTGLVTRFGEDPFRSMIVDGISSEQIDLSHATLDQVRPNGLYFISRDPSGERTFHYRRSDSAARAMFAPGSLDVDSLVSYLASARMLYLSGITLAILEDRDILFEILHHLRTIPGLTIAFDPNVRPALWEGPSRMIETVEQILPLIDVFLPSADDVRLLYGGERDPESVVTTLGIDHVLLKKGARGGVLLHDGATDRYSTDRTRPVVDTTGAGDGLNAGYLAGLLRGESPEDALAQGARVADAVLDVAGAINPDFLPRDT